MGDLVELLGQDLDESEFYAQMLGRLRDRLGAVNAAVWQSGETGRPALLHQVGVDQAILFRNPETQSQHDQIIATVLAKGSPGFFPAAARAEGGLEGIVEYAVMLTPVRRRGPVQATLERHTAGIS